MSGLLAGMGDRTTSGGEVISATSTYMDSGKVMCRSGDQAYCPACKGTFPVSGTAIHWAENGVPMVQNGDRVLCRCKYNRVIAHSTSFYNDPASPTNQVVSPHAALSASFADPATYNDRFQLLDDHTGQPLAGTEYAVRRETGEIEHGVTDSQGYTHLVDDQDNPEEVIFYCNGMEVA
ncbi:PAAR domain-containing protein [Silvimonas sp.]|uniref:PAAR domain-containing protein n=1 Tax=Silvimonas sp. TaxID=2650811 RepID=UPI0028529E8F|nr:PAAR domain-containing protein [Silvimonas sp.]